MKYIVGLLLGFLNTFLWTNFVLHWSQHPDNHPFIFPLLLLSFLSIAIACREVYKLWNVPTVN